MSAGGAPGTFTQMAFEVDDLEAVVTTLKERGVVFEEVDAPGLRTVDGIANVEGNYPSKGTGERAVIGRRRKQRMQLRLVERGQLFRDANQLTTKITVIVGEVRDQRQRSDWAGDAFGDRMKASVQFDGDVGNSSCVLLDV